MVLCRKAKRLLMNMKGGEEGEAAEEPGMANADDIGSEDDNDEAVTIVTPSPSSSPTDERNGQVVSEREEYSHMGAVGPIPAHTRVISSKKHSPSKSKVHCTISFIETIPPPPTLKKKLNCPF